MDDDVDELVRRSRAVFRTAAGLTGEAGQGPRDLRSAETVLARAEQTLVRALTETGDHTGRARLAVALSQVSGTLVQVKEARIAARSAGLDELRRSLNRLRSAISVAELVDRVPVEINHLGYRRALFSRLSGPDWSARSAFAYADPQLARDLVEIGTAIPGRLGRELPETEVVRTRTPILVEDAQHNPHVHHRLITLARTRDYVVAPLIGRGEVIGLVHADQHVDTDRVDAFDQRLLGLFAEGLGCIFERVVLADRLGRLRDQLIDQAGSVDELLGGVDRVDAPEPAADPLARLEGPFSELTRREVDVLRHLVQGRTNSQIAAELFVSPGTVKTHVKNLLHKLGAANRAEATARYHALTRR
ncbi:LuxR family transcriptional regulator [Amycolatopsis sp. NBRC 101858]|uniref:LuxR C-terminal-related transcriptional regulator n=1 Tax=Amycolatopsis sp. NBRC 101858 TaxID=3032200 RepID=UPI0024A199B0|nr:LuxR C-terminal-related transcriptional regulator [Amycolatopsis sp. NBRC 101858]GLY40436.1 LuxR family transcriptional regulator [Amycolatopsis sp. NBRC 101858]